MLHEVEFKTYGELTVEEEVIREGVAEFVAEAVKMMKLPVVDERFIKQEVLKSIASIDLSSFVMKDGRKITKRLWGAITREVPLVASLNKERNDAIYNVFCAIVRKYYAPIDSFVAQVRDALDLNLGVWNDSYSCFRDGKERSFTPFFFHKNGIMLLTINQSRAWLWEIDNETICVFNAYGRDISNNSDRALIAEAVRRLYGWARCKYKYIECYSGILYINNDRALVISFGDKLPNKIDMDLYEFICPFCGRIARLNDFVALNSDSYSFFWVYNGHEAEGRTVLMCERCYDDGVADELCTEQFYYCYRCDERLYESEAYFVNGEVYCEGCFDNLFFYCSECGEPSPRDEAYETCNGDLVCSYCSEHYYTECDRCHLLVKDDDARYINDDECYCPDCYYEETRERRLNDEYIEE